MPAQTGASYADEELDPAQQEESEQHEGVAVVTRLVELRVARALVGGDGPSAPPTGPVVGKVAEGRLPPDPDRPVASLDGTLDTPRRQRVTRIQGRGQEPGDVPRTVGQADPAVADEHGAEGVGAPYAPDQARGGEVVPVLAGAAQALDVAEVEVLQDDDLDLCGEGHEGPGGLLGGRRWAGYGDVGGICALADCAPSPELLEPRGGWGGLQVPLAACG